MRFLWLVIITTVYLASAVSAKSTAQGILTSLDPASVLHFTLSRRGGAFSTTEREHDWVNLTYLVHELERTERRFSLTKREAKGNKLVRKAKADETGGKEAGSLMGDIAANGTWFVKMKIGDPPQEIEVDLNMLASDFYVVTTSSEKGNKFDDYFSKSHTKSLDHPYPNCGQPTDLFHLPTVNSSWPLAFVYCRPQKFTRRTLAPSGSVLGLAPSMHLKQTRSSSFISQLLKNNVIERSIFSLMLVNGQAGVLSIGGTGASAVDLVIQQTRKELDRLGALEEGEVPAIATTESPASKEKSKPLLKRGGSRRNDFGVRAEDWRDGWKWSHVQGAEGWWQMLMQGVWVDGSRVLQNQAAVVDINSPFILAPPHAAKALYASMSGSHPLPPPFSKFYAFPCLNPPTLNFQFGSALFPAMHGGRGADWSHIPGSRFSLGRLESGSGYCVGSVVETSMGVREKLDELTGDSQDELHTATRRGGMAGNGMRDVWVIGEGFFRGVGGVFDLREQQVGFRSY